MVAWLPVQGQMFSGKNLPGPWKWVPSQMVRRQGESPGVQGGLFPGGKPQLPSVLGSTGWYRFLGASPGWSRALLALLALLVLIGCTPLITFFGCRWMLLVALVAYSPLPYSHFPP